MQAVPLSWVKHLAHDRGKIDVWATGNQLLREEAMIPGISDAITSWRKLTLPDDLEQYHKYVPPQARRPSRRKGLHLIQAIYEKVAAFYDVDIQLLVVDDVNLTDLETDGWQHYYPWDFVAAVEQNTAPLSIPLPLKKLSEIPLTNADCPESYPPLDYDTPKVLTYFETRSDN